mgnify:CR=1 FL=1
MYNISEQFEYYFPSWAAAMTVRPFQEKAIQNVLMHGNTLCIMPTGSGKSLIYYLSGLISGGITIVISPLVALIDEQEQKLRDQGIETLVLHSGLTAEKQFLLLKQFAQKKINPKFIFASPEKLATDGFFEYCIKCRKDEIKMITIDEVHCVSQWGMQFRPFYAEIPAFISSVFGDLWPKILALTATLNPRELADVVAAFQIKTENILKYPQFIRSEISLKVVKCVNEDEKEEKLWSLLEIHKHEKTLVYVYRVKGGRSVEDFSYRANQDHQIKSAFFHGEMSAKERQEIIAKFKRNEIDVIFATNAFGMGIDISDIRTVIHYWIPESVEQYYQEVGRAARDGIASNAYLLYSEKNIAVRRKNFIDKSFPDKETFAKFYARTFKSQPGLQTLPYFDDEDTAKCLHYLIAIGLIKIVAKGFGDLQGLSNIKDAELYRVYNATRTKNLISSSKKTGMPTDKLVDLVYDTLVHDRAQTKKLDKRLVIELTKSGICDEDWIQIESQISEKRQYRHDLLDYFLYVLSNTTNSIELHQEICRYLGSDKDNLNKIYSTLKGDMVRSKSEVIIANMLYHRGLEYVYEKELVFEGGQMRPDFTVTTPKGRIIYWEHLGLLGTENYDETWLIKKRAYDSHYPGQLEVTYEGATISTSAAQKIDALLQM